MRTKIITILMMLLFLLPAICFSGYYDGYAAAKESSRNYAIGIVIAGIAIGVGIYFGLRGKGK